MNGVRHHKGAGLLARTLELAGRAETTETSMEHVRVLIIGAGISGIGTACHLRMSRPLESMAILEGRERIGGTWDLFRYPGIRSDSDMFSFGFVFKPWVEEADIATGEAILRYLNETVDEFGVRPLIRFKHFVRAVHWSSQRQRWVADVAHDGRSFQISADVLVTGTGYYNYDKGHLPDFPGLDDYQGVVAAPQHWPETLDYDGKRVLVIGSGATAVTIVPAMAERAAHVTMLQRSPTYILSRPARDAVAQTLRKVLPEPLAYRMARFKAIFMQRYGYTVARRRPELMRKFVRDEILKALGPDSDIDVDLHFNPSYAPWDQRMCLVPDADLFVALREGKASVVTDTLTRFTSDGVELSSGQKIEADVVVPATGLELQFGGGMSMTVDGREIEASELICYRGMMFGGIPNWVAMFGYTSASWTLKTDLTANFLCRLLDHMDAQNLSSFVPIADQPEMPTQSILSNLRSASYIQRAAHRMPRQGMTSPWRNKDGYVGDYLSVKYGPIDDGTLRFRRRDGAMASPPRSWRLPASTRAFTFQGKTAVVTGAASGIGRSLAVALAGAGCDLALLDLQEAPLEEVAQLARRQGVTVSTHLVDMGDADAIARFADELDEAHPHVDLLFNNAGVALGGHFTDVSAEEFEWLMAINFHGVVRMTRALLPRLQARPDAAVVNVSSVFGIIAPPGQAAYAASKFAVRGFSEALRHELADTSVMVATVFPGGVKTAIARSARVAQKVLSGLEADAHESRVAAMEKNFITTPQRAAEIILAGVTARRARILVGPDAQFIDLYARVTGALSLQGLKRIFNVALVMVCLGALTACGGADYERGSGASSGTSAQCGDGACDDTEDATACPQDCPGEQAEGRCGDGVCQPDEAPASCPEDCRGEPAPPQFVCGDGVCEPPEDEVSCRADCGTPDPQPACGDGVCQEGETELSCAEDCSQGVPPVQCGDGVCAPGEDPTFCREDCPLVICTPFVPEAENDCRMEGQSTCVAVTSEEGVCYPSGDVPEGGECQLLNGEPLGSCVGDSICIPRSGDDGTCRRLCEAWAPEERPPNCPGGQICAPFGRGIIGFCTPDTFEEPLEAGEACSVEGFWCSEKALCIAVDNQGNNACLGLCRLERGDEDCEEGVRCQDILPNAIAIGACRP